MRILALAAILALTACSRSEEPEKGTSVSIDIDDSDDAKNGKVALSFPGGIKADITVPEGVAKDSDFDIEGVGLYPGAVVSTVNIRALSGKDKSASIAIGFTAPGDAAAVADWYEAEFARKAVPVTRTGETFTGRTKDDDPFTLAMTPGATGTRGLLTIGKG